MKPITETLTLFLIGTIMSSILWVSFIKDDYKWENKVNPAVMAWVKDVSANE